MAKPFLFEKFRGVNNVLAEDSLFHPEEGVFLRAAINVDIDNAFKIRRRKGYRRVVPGQIHSLWSDGDICLFREGTALKRLFEDWTTVTLRNDLGGDLPMSFLSHDGKIYYSDTTYTGVMSQGVDRTWGIVPPPTPGVAATGGEAPAGRYLVAVTYIRDDSQESGAESPTAITLSAAGGLSISLTPSDDPDVTAVRLYISAPDGNQLYLAGIYPNSAHTGIYRGGPLGRELKTIFLQPAPAGQLLEYLLGKIYVAAGQYVFPSKAYGYELFDFEDFLPFDGIITLLGAVEDGLWVSDGKKTYFLENGKKRHEGLPHTAIPGTMVKVNLDAMGDGSMSGQALMWASDKGIILGLKGGVTKNLTEANYIYDSASWGAGLFRQQNGINQYLVLLRDGDGLTDRVYKWQKITSGELEVGFNVTGTST
jgi:hypothetical protein